MPPAPSSVNAASEADEQRRVLGGRHVLEDPPEPLAVREVAALEVEGQRVADDRIVAVAQRRRRADREPRERDERERSSEGERARHARKPMPGGSVSCPDREPLRRSRRRRAAAGEPAVPALRRRARVRRRDGARRPRRGDHGVQRHQSARRLHGAPEHGRRVLLRDLGLPALPPVPRGALRRPAGAAHPRLRAPARAAHRPRLLARADGARRDGRAVRRLQPRLVDLLRAPAEQQPGDGAVRHRGGVVAVHRGRLLRRPAAVGAADGARPARALVAVDGARRGRRPGRGLARLVRGAHVGVVGKYGHQSDVDISLLGNADWFAYGMGLALASVALAGARARLAHRARRERPRLGALGARRVPVVARRHAARDGPRAAAGLRRHRAGSRST